MEKSIQEALNDFTPVKKAGKFYETHQPITVWVPNDSKTDYDKIQLSSGQDFSKVLRDVVVSAIAFAKQKIA